MLSFLLPKGRRYVKINNDSHEKKRLVVKNDEGERNMPNDPVMLLSFVNMKLRDCYKDIESLCSDYHVTVEELSDKLKVIDYHYDRKTNQYK